MVVLQVKIKT